MNVIFLFYNSASSHTNGEMQDSFLPVCVYRVGYRRYFDADKIADANRKPFKHDLCLVIELQVKTAWRIHKTPEGSSPLWSRDSNTCKNK